MKTLVVCGDSWMSPVKGHNHEKYEGTHFSEIIAKKLNYKLITYSMSGMSMGGICIQLKTALELNPKPDLIIFNTTTSTRFEWPINDVDEIRDISVQDIYYCKKESLSHYNEELNRHPKIICHSIDYIVDKQVYMWENKDKYGKERLEALTQYLTWLYHPDLKRFMDSCMMYGMIRRVHDSNIPYLILLDNGNSIARQCSWMSENNYASYDVELFDYGHHDYNWEDPGYHTTVECQKKIADLLLTKYIPKLLNDQ